MNPLVDRFPFAARAEVWLATRFDSVNFDDYLYVSENPMVADGRDWASFGTGGWNIKQVMDRLSGRRILAVRAGMRGAVCPDRAKYHDA